MSQKYSLNDELWKMLYFLLFLPIIYHRQIDYPDLLFHIRHTHTLCRSDSHVSCCVAPTPSCWGRSLHTPRRSQTQLYPRHCHYCCRLSRIFLRVQICSTLGFFLVLFSLSVLLVLVWVLLLWVFWVFWE